MCMSVIRQRLLDSVDNYTEDSEEVEDDSSDDDANTDLTQVADAGELQPKGKLKQVTKDIHEYYTSHTTSDFRVGVGTFCAAKYVREEREENWCRVVITSTDADDVGVFYIDNGKMAATIKKRNTVTFDVVFMTKSRMLSGTRIHI